MGQLGIWVWIPLLPPFYCNSIISEKIFGLEFGFSFTFFYIFVGPVERIYKTSHITMLSVYFFPSNLQSFGDELNRSSKMALQIFELMKIESKYLDISNCVFTMNCSTDKKIVFWSFLWRDFICMWEKFQRCQSSNSSFLQKYPIFWTTNVQILFFWLNICIFTPVQTKENSSWSKNE